MVTDTFRETATITELAQQIGEEFLLTKDEQYAFDDAILHLELDCYSEGDIVSAWQERPRLLEAFMTYIVRAEEQISVA